METEHEHLNVRNDDPDTSAAAAAQIEEYVPHIQELILRALIKRSRGLTTRELAYNLGIDFATITPRMRPMAEKGWVEMTQVRAKNPYGKGWGRVWIILPAGRGVVL